MRTNSPTSLLDFIRRRVGFGELVRWQVDWIPYPRILSHFLLFCGLGFRVIFRCSVFWDLESFSAIPLFQLLGLPKKVFMLKFHKSNEVLTVKFHYGYWNTSGVAQHQLNAIWHVQVPNYFYLTLSLCEKKLYQKLLFITQE